MRDYGDLDTPKSQVYRCRSFLGISVIVALSSLAFLLFSLNLNVLNLERSPSHTDGATETAMDFIQNMAVAFSFPSPHNFNVSRQFEVFAVSFVESIVAILLMLRLFNIKKLQQVDRKRRMAASSLMASLGLVHFSIVCVLATVLILLLRFYRYAIPNDWSLTCAIIVGLLVFAPVITWCVRRQHGVPSNAFAGVALGPVACSLITPLLITCILIFNAVWVNERFNPALTVILSESCGAPDKGACALTFKPQDIDGSIALDGVRIEKIILGYADESRIVGPRDLIPARASFRIIQSPDTPLPLQISTDVVAGVVGHIQFDCPAKLSGGSRKLIVVSYRATAATRPLDGPDYGAFNNVPVLFASNGDITRLIRNASDGCMFFPRG